MVPIGYSYPRPELDIYVRSFTGKCLVSFHEPENLFHESRTFIVDMNKPFDFNLSHEKVSVLEDLPSYGEVFVVDFGEDGLHRAVCSDGENKSLLFIDCGEIIDASSLQWTMYSLSERAQSATARAIPCEVEQMTDEKGNKIDDITELFSMPVLFSVVDIKDDKLVVTLRKFQQDDSTEPKKEEEVQKEVDEANTPAHGQVDVTEEQRAQLYEEPEMITTNAMKAIYGYDPQDDKRICPFYDEKTGGCYKGNGCRLLHVSKIMDGWTRDRKQAMIKLANDEVPLVGSTVKVCVTCIVNVDEFYIHIPEISARYDPGSLEELKNELNDPEIVKYYKPFVGQPSDLQHDLVFVKRQGLFYRAKVIDYDEEQYSYIIYFLDYGYTELIPQKAIFHWYPRWNTVPALAYRCCFENVKRIAQKDEDAKIALRNLFLGTSDISAKIMAYTGELYVQLFDSYGINIGETLAALQLVELKPKTIPSSTQIPG